MRINNIIPINFNATEPVRRYSNLAPLAYDTVSFTSRAKQQPQGQEPARANKAVSNSSDKNINQSERPPLKNAASLYNESDFAFAQLNFILNNIFGESVIDIDSPGAEERLGMTVNENKNKPVVFITGRRKSPESIVEKMATTHIKSKGKAKEELHDLIGARVVVSGTSQESGNYVIDKLTEAVKKGRIKVEAVKLHGQENPKLNYASRSKLNRLVETSRKNGSPMCRYADEPRDTGYLAIHVITGEIADGYNGEIQIMGVDTNKFKEIEDLIYKFKTGKNVPREYAQLWAEYDAMGDAGKAMYDEYTKRAYAYERQKPVHNKDKYTDYLPIPPDLEIPQSLDFNNIEKQKRRIDSGKSQNQ